MRIVKISVKKLFGVYDHEIPLNQESRITILHGPNGVGKTILLRMVHGLFNSDLNVFFEVPFSVFRIESEDGTAFEVTRNSARTRESGATASIRVARGNESNKIHRVKISRRDNKWLSEKARDYSVQLIETSRLWKATNQFRDVDSSVVNERPQEMIPTVTRLSESLVNRVRNEEKEFDSARSRIKRAKGKVRTLESLEENMTSRIEAKERVSQEVLELLRSGLRGSRDAADSAFERNQLVITFRRIMSDLLELKRVDFKPDGTIVAISANDELLPLSMLSSGEQHQLVLFYDLLFDVPQHSLVLIDEPEISLHVTWQRRFLDNVEEIVGLRHIDVLVATHSPQIVNSRRDLMVGLGNIEHAR